MALTFFSAATVVSLASNMLVAAAPVSSAGNLASTINENPSIWEYPDAVPGDHDYTGTESPDLEVEDDEQTLTESIARKVNSTQAKASARTSSDGASRHIEQAEDSATDKTRYSDKGDAITLPDNEKVDSIAPIPSHDVEIDPRGIAPDVYNDTMYCHIYRQPFTMVYRIGVHPNPEITEENADDYCQGLWDNLHHRACTADVNLFGLHECGWDSEHGRLTWEFATSHFCAFHQVEETFKLATYGKFDALKCEEWKSWVGNTWDDHTRRSLLPQGNETREGEVTIDPTTSIIPLPTSEPTTLVTARPVPTTTPVPVADKGLATAAQIESEIVQPTKRGDDRRDVYEHPHPSLGKSATSDEAQHFPRSYDTTFNTINSTNNSTIAVGSPLGPSEHGAAASPARTPICLNGQAYNAFGTFQKWHVAAPEVPSDEIEDWCGGLWDNLHHRKCSVYKVHFCGRNPAPEGGLIWQFSTHFSCTGFQVEEAFLHATDNGRFGVLHCETAGGVPQERDIDDHSIDESAIASNTTGSTGLDSTTQLPEPVQLAKEPVGSVDVSTPVSNTDIFNLKEFDSSIPIFDSRTLNTSHTPSNSSLLDKREWIKYYPHKIPNFPKPGVLVRCYLDDDMLRTWRVEVPSVPDDKIEDHCRGIWDNLYGLFCQPTAAYVCGKSGAEEGGLMWRFSTSAVCDEKFVKIAWYKGTEKGMWGGLECKDMDQYDVDHS